MSVAVLASGRPYNSPPCCITPLALSYCITSRFLCTEPEPEEEAAQAPQPAAPSPASPPEEQAPAAVPTANGHAEPPPDAAKSAAQSEDALAAREAELEQARPDPLEMR